MTWTGFSAMIFLGIHLNGVFEYFLIFLSNLISKDVLVDWISDECDGDDVMSMIIWT